MGQQNLLQRMKYVFDKITPRRATNSYKWDTAHDDDVLPMWVADMDFRTAPAVVEALRKRWNTVSSVTQKCLRLIMRQ